MAAVVGEVELDALEGFYKRVYASELERAVPIDTVLQNMVSFREDESDGENFNQPVSLKLAQGMSFAATNSGAFALNAAAPSQTRNAQLTGSQHLLRHSLSYEAAAKAAKSERAFKRATVHHMQDMKEALHKFLEIDLMAGQFGIGRLGTIATATPISTAYWASGFWSGMDGMTTLVYDTAGGVVTGLPSTTLRATGGRSITSTDLDARTVTFNATTNLVATDSVVFGVDGTSEQWTGTAWNSMVGLHRAATHSSGNLWNISSTTHSLWKANSQAAGSTDLSFGTIQKAVAKSMARGGSGNITCLVSPLTWANLMTNQAALRQYGAERRTWENGSEGIRFWSQTGSIDITASIYCFEGFAYLIQPAKFKRIGASDVTFDMSKFGLPGGAVFRHMENNAGIEWRAYSHQALFTSKLGHVTIITGIVNS